MKQISALFTALILSVVTSGVLVNSVQAECYGDAIAAYGCNVPKNTARAAAPAAKLEMFGSSAAPVLPDLGYHNQNQNPNDVITAEERHRMMRNIVLGKRNATRSQSIQLNAVNSASRPLRRSGSMPARTR